MERLWGEVLPVPADRLRVLNGGEVLGPFHVAYTPGHASHHVSYLHEPSGRAFTGDVTGVRIGSGPVMAPTPPPDIDLKAWRASLAVIEAWRPASLAPTHFGAYDDVAAHLAALRDQLDRVEGMAGDLDQAGFCRSDPRPGRRDGRCRDGRRLRAGDASGPDLSGPDALSGAARADTLTARRRISD